MNTPPPLHLISSMATQKLLAELLAADALAHPDVAVRLESVGGVDAARRVAAGEAFDAVVLGADALQRLMAGGHVHPDSRVDLVHSGVAVAVRAGAPRPDIGTEAALKAAVLAARSVGCSTGPSGVALAALFERWGIADAVRAKQVTPPPGTPVGALIARGEVELGFQQLSELLPIHGIDLVGPLPAEAQRITMFSAGIAARTRHRRAARKFIRYLSSASAARVISARGMEP